jgi:HSP20 family protein
MNLLENKSLLRNLLFQGDQLHTLGGGIVQITMEIDKREDGYLISIFAPSTSAESFKILTEGSVMQLYAVQLNQQSSSVNIPLFYRRIELPEFADVTGVIAEYRGNKLKVFIPIGLNTTSGNATSAKHEIQIKQL